jgi:hypothetical protein
MSKPLRPGFLVFVCGVTLTIISALYVVLAELWLGITAPNTPNFRKGQIFPWHITGRHGFDGLTHYITKLNHIIFHASMLMRAPAKPRSTWPLKLSRSRIPTGSKAHAINEGMLHEFSQI